MSVARAIFAMGAVCLLGGLGAGAALTGCDQGTQTKPKGTVIDVTEAAGKLDEAIDATPDPIGQELYFIARVSTGRGVFKVSAGGGAVTEVASGAPLVEPRGIAMSTAGDALFVADASAGPDGSGAIFVIDPGEGTASVLAGSEGLHPRALDVIEGMDADEVYFAGETAEGAAAIFRLPEGGGAAAVLAEGGMLAAPDGLAVTADGTVYVTDHGSGDPGEGRVLQISGKSVTPVVEDVLLGEPAGIALLLDESAILVSSVDPKTETSQVLIVDGVKFTTSTFNDVIGENVGSGGLHRAHTKNVFAWAGYQKTTTGVYTVKVTPQPKSSSAIAGAGD